MPPADCRASLDRLLSENRTVDSHLAGGAAIPIEPNARTAPEWGRRPRLEPALPEGRGASAAPGRRERGPGVEFLLAPGPLVMYV